MGAGSGQLQGAKVSKTLQKYLEVSSFIFFDKQFCGIMLQDRKTLHEVSLKGTSPENITDRNRRFQRKGHISNVSKLE